MMSKDELNDMRYKRIMEWEKFGFSDAFKESIE